MGTPHIVLAEDFNCTLKQGDTTGTINRCRALTDLINGLALRDAWQRSSAHPGYTHYSSAGASRIYRIYVTGDLLQRKKGMETIATAFTDHLAVSLHITTDVPLVRRGRGIWRMDTDMLAEHNIHEQIKALWGQCQHQKRYFPNSPMWWDRCCKKKLTLLPTSPKKSSQRTQNVNELLF
jgi:hypothetical protein